MSLGTGRAEPIFNSKALNLDSRNTLRRVKMVLDGTIEKFIELLVNHVNFIPNTTKN